jgi:hypothetical protein
MPTAIEHTPEYASLLAQFIHVTYTQAYATGGRRPTMKPVAAMSRNTTNKT